MSCLTLHAGGMLKRRSAAYRALHAEVLTNRESGEAFSVIAPIEMSIAKTDEFRDKQERARERALHPWVD